MAGKQLKRSGKTLSVAESCTGGLLGHLLTSVPGSSDYFMGGVIAYNNRVKISQLRVSKTSLKKFGAVSETVAKEMAKNVRRLFKTDLGVAVTGIAGPKSGDSKKPVGLVYIAVSNSKKVICKKFLFHGSRAQIKSLSAHSALKLLLSSLQ